MMKKLIFLLAFFFIISCKKNVDPLADSNGTIIYHLESDAQASNGSISWYFTYDKNGNLLTESRYLSNKIDTYIIYNYNSSGKLISYNYANDSLNAGINYPVLYNNNNQISQTNIYGDFIYKFQYDNSGKVIADTIFNLQGTMFSYDNFGWDGNGNVISFETYDVQNGYSLGKFTWKHDDKINPFGIAGWAQANIAKGNILTLSKNNILGEYSGTEPASQQKHFLYYNNGLPKVDTLVSGNSTDGIDRYYYK